MQKSDACYFHPGLQYPWCRSPLYGGGGGGTDAVWEEYSSHALLDGLLVHAVAIMGFRRLTRVKGLRLELGVFAASVTTRNASNSLIFQSSSEATLWCDLQKKKDVCKQQNRYSVVSNQRWHSQWENIKIDRLIQLLILVEWICLGFWHKRKKPEWCSTFILTFWKKCEFELWICAEWHCVL